MHSKAIWIWTGAVWATWAVFSAAHADPSFDCNKAGTRVENMICDDQRLAKLDSRLAEVYRTALRDSPWASANKRIRREQREWIAERNKCRSNDCLRGLYYQRVGSLIIEVPDKADEKGPPKSGVMMARCRGVATQAFLSRGPDVETKYEGQRTDGTHAVNGTAYIGDQKETFQCSFDKNGIDIVQFIVNQ